MPQWQHRGCKLQKKGEPQQKQTHDTYATAQHPQQNNYKHHVLDTGNSKNNCNGLQHKQMQKTKQQ